MIFQKRKLVTVLGGSVPNSYRPVKPHTTDVEGGSKPAPTVKKIPPAKPPPPKLPPSTTTQPAFKTDRSNTRTRPAKPGGPKKPSEKLYPSLSETSPEVPTDKKNTDTELSTYPVFRPRPNKPGKIQAPVVKPVAVTDLRRGGERNARSAFTRVPSSLTRPATDTSSDLASVSDIDSMDSESYEKLLKEMGLSKADFKAKIPKPRYMMPEDYL